jgi:hypothetical protein
MGTAEDSAEVRWSWWTPVLDQDSAEVRQMIVVDTWSGQWWGEEGDRGGHLCLIRTMLRWGRWSWWTPPPDQDSAEVRTPVFDQESAEVRKVIVMDTRTLSGQCWREEGDRGGHVYLIRTVLRWGRWSCWTPLLDQDSAEEKKVIVVDTRIWSGQCWGEEGGRGGHLYSIKTVPRWGRWSWWTRGLLIKKSVW